MPMPTAEILARSRAQWTAAAPTWEPRREIIAASTRAVTDALLEALRRRRAWRSSTWRGTGDPTGRLAPGGRGGPRHVLRT
jgi:hypothetical protein